MQNGEDFGNVLVEAKDIYLLTLNPLMSGDKKGNRCLNKNLQVQYAGLFSAYGQLLPLGLNWLTQLVVCKICKVNNPLQMFENNYYEKKKMHGLHKHVLRKTDNSALDISFLNISVYLLLIGKI